MLKSRMLPCSLFRQVSVRPGFTSTGIIIFLGVAGLLTAVALPAIQDHRRQNDIHSTIQRMTLIVDSLQEYSREHCGYFPTSRQGLESLIPDNGSPFQPDQKPVGSTIPRDSWGNTFLYISPGVMNPDAFDICSSGPDQVLGTADDINNWTTE